MAWHRETLRLEIAVMFFNACPPLFYRLDWMANWLGPLIAEKHRRYREQHRLVLNKRHSLRVKVRRSDPTEREKLLAKQRELSAAYRERIKTDPEKQAKEAARRARYNARRSARRVAP